MRLHPTTVARYDGCGTLRLRRRALLAVAAAVIAIPTGVGVAAAATWSPAMTVPSSEAGTDSVIARDGDGADTIGWLRSAAGAAPDRIAASTRLLGGPFSTGLLSVDTSPPVDPPAIAGDSTGPVAVAWVAKGPALDDPSQIDYAVGGSGGLEGRQILPSALTGDDPASVDVAITPTGETIFTWTQTIADVSRVRAVIRSAAGVLSPVATLSDDAGDASEPRAAAAAGGAVVTWLQTTETTTTAGNRETATTVTRVQVARRTSSGFTAGVTASEATETTVTTTRGEDETSVTTGQELESPQAAADDQDGAAIALLLTGIDEHDPPLPTDSRTSAAQVSSGSLSAGVGAPATISSPGQDADGLSLSVAPNGAGVLAWTAGSSVYAARRAPGGPYGAAQLVAATGTEPATAIRAGGAPIVVFRAAGQIFAVLGVTDGAFELPMPLGPTDAPSSAPAVAADARGGAAATWTVDPTPAEGDESIRVAELQPEPDAPESPPPLPPPPPAPPPPPPPAPSPTAPSSQSPLNLTNLAVEPTCIRYGFPLDGQRRRLSFDFVLSEAASVRLTIQRRLNSGVLERCPSRRVRGEAGRLGAPVVVDHTAGGGAGEVSVGDEGEAVSARAARGRRTTRALTRRPKSSRRRILLAQSATTLAPGTYVAHLTATSADGRRSATLKVKFWVLRSSE